MRFNVLRILAVFLLSFILFPRDAHAYLDPGSGSMLISALVAMVTIVIFMAKSFIYDKVKILGKKSDLPDLKREYNIVVYSEGGQYWNVFLPIIQELEARGESAVYFTSKQDDPGLMYECKHIEKKYIGEGHSAFFVLNKLKANIVLMTTPGLGVLQIKRSKGVKHYCHITHSAGTCSSYKAFSLDYFDSVLVGGNADKDIISELEEKRKTAKKQVEIIGCTYLDVLRAKLKNGNYTYSLFGEKKPTILISPTWGEHGLLSKYGNDILAMLSGCKDFNVIVRPHPQSFTSEKNLMNELLHSYPDSDNLKWDNEKDGLKAMFHADLMVSDFSGIIYDYLFLFERPVLTFKSQFEKRGREAMDLKEESADIKYLDKIGRTLKETDIPDLISIIKKSLSEKNALPEVIKEAEKALARNPGESGKRAADFIQSVLKSVK
jgi:hypothetical protein